MASILVESFEIGAMCKRDSIC